MTTVAWVDLSSVLGGYPLSVAPTARRLLYCSSKIYLVGDGSVFIYDIVGDSWSFGADCPALITDAVIALHDGKIYLYGGYDQDVNSYNLTLYVYDISGNLWTTGGTSTARYMADADVSSDKIYIVGGQIDGLGTLTSELLVYDILEESFSVVSTGGTARKNHSAHIVDGILYIFDGRDETDTVLEITDVYDISGNSWSTLSQIAVDIPASALSGGKIWFWSGTDEIWQENNKLRQFDPTTEARAIIAYGEHVRDGGIACIDGDGNMYIYGGTVYIYNSGTGLYDLETDPTEHKFQTCVLPVEYIPPTYTLAHKLPTGDYLLFGFTGSYEDVNDSIGATDTDNYISAYGSGSYIAEFTFDIFELPRDSEIEYIKITYWAKSSMIAGEAQLYPKASDELGTYNTLTSGWVEYSYQWDIDPNTGLSWTAETINDFLTFGAVAHLTGPGEVFVAQIYLSVSYFDPPYVPSVLELYYTHNAIDYTLVPFSAIEGVSWKNLQGFPCNGISVLNSTEEGYTDLVVGNYIIDFDDSSVDVYNTGMEVCETTYLPHSDDKDACLSALTPVSVSVNEGSLVEVDCLENNENKQLVPGISIEFSETPQTFHRCRFEVGGFWIEAEQRFVNPLLWENIVLGTSFTKGFKIKNTSVSIAYGCKARVFNKATVTQTTPGSPFFSFYQAYDYSPTPCENLAITFANLEAGTPNAIQLLVGGIGSDMVNVGTEEIMVEGKGLLCDGSTAYMFAEGTLYEGITVILNENTNASSTATLTIYDASMWNIGEAETSLGKDVDLGDIAGESETAFYIQCSPNKNIDAETCYGLLQIVSEETALSIALTANPIEPGIANLDNALFLRCAVVDSAMYTNFVNFGLSLAS